MITQIIMFPGVLFHELSHYIICKVLGVEVRKFRVSIKNESGFVEHNVPKSIIKSILISIASSILAILVSILLLYFLFNNLIIDIIILYLVFILLYTSFPSKEDTKFYRHHNLLKKIITFPLFIILYVYQFFTRSMYLRVIYTFIVMIAILFWS